MASSERVLFGLVGGVLLVSLIQGLQSGVMSGEFDDFDLRDRPIRFALTAAGNAVALLVCAIVAAGYQPEDFWRLAAWATKTV